jgi:transcription factor TFIIIB component B''
MLKNRGKIFAPKAKGIVRRQPSAAPSSARPSVERQSQPPAPRQESVVSVVEEGTAAEAVEPREPGAEAQSQEDSNQTRIPLPDTAAHPHPSPDTRKRKTRDEDIPEPPAKRIPVNIERAESSTEPTTSTQEPDHETHSHPTSHDTHSTQRSNLKRKEREEDNVEPQAKRVSTEVGSREQPTTEFAISQQTQNVEATPRATSTHELVKSSEAAQPTRQSSEPDAENSTAENNDDEESQSSREPTFQAPQYQYPDPENMNIARIVDDIPGARLGSMGPAGGNGSGLGAAGDLGAAGRNIQAAQFSEIVPRGVLNPDGTSGGIIEEVASGTEKTKRGKRKYIKRKKVQAPEIGDDGRATVEMQLVKPRREKGQRRVRRKADGNRERKQRAATPEGAEEEEIDRENMTMTDLCKDLRIGRPFSMHAEIKARIQKKKADLARIKLRKEHPELIPLMDAEDDAPAGEVGQAGPSGTNSALAAELEVQEVSAPAAAGPQMRIIDGQIVIDDRTLQIDRQKRAQALQAEMTEVEENDFTRVITSGTWMKMERSQVWDASANALFYDCLSRHGTDFEMIASYFPHRNRRQIKLKFNKEERNNPAKITKAMTNPRKKPIDLEEYQKMSNIQLEEVAAIDKERAEYDAEQLAEQNKQEAAKAEVTRKKKEAIQNTSAAARRVLASVELSDDEEDAPDRAAGGESAKENREPAGRSKSAEAPAPKGGKKKAAPKKPRKNKHSHYAGGDEVEVLGTID